MSYDRNLYTLTVKVEEKGGMLVISDVYYTNAAGRSYRDFPIVFSNTYGSYTPYVPVVPPKTPDKLNADDHFAYVIGYPDGGVHPHATITRAETATIFFRLLRDEVRDGAFTTSNTYSDVAYGKWYLQDNLIFAEGNPYCGTQIQGSAIYTDKYVKVDGEWLIEDTGYLRVYEESFQRDKTHRIRINMFRPKKKKVIKKK